MKKQKILIICKASINDGLGHLIRSATLADYLAENYPDLEIAFLLISDLNLSNEISKKIYPVKVIPNDSAIKIDQHFTHVILDMLTLDAKIMAILQSQIESIISISPIFNRLEDCTLLITRTKYTNFDIPKTLSVKAGMEYSIIRKDCEKISSERFQANLKRKSLNIAISMGGTDPENLTLKYLKEFKNFEQDLVFWVLLGEGYEHNYKDLSDIIKENRNHEIILARTNKNMWHILSNCSMAILKGGLTSYETVYAGLPAINVFSHPRHSFLVNELVENKLCLKTCYSVEETLAEFQKAIIDRAALFSIHQNTKAIFKAQPMENVAKAILN